MIDAFPQVPAKPVLYDYLHCDTDKDIDMYSRLTDGHTEILECGVGTGRLAIPLAKQGRTVHGFDYSAAMLRECEKKLTALPQETRSRIKLCEADMREFELERQFSFVFVPLGSFVFLLTHEEQRSCLAALRRHLADNGTLVLDLPTWTEAMDEKWLANDSVMRKWKHVTEPDTGKTIEIWSAFRFDSSTQVLEQDRRYRFFTKEGIFEREQVVCWRSRFFFLDEFKLLLELSGLQISEVYGDFQFGPYRHDSEVAVVLIKKRQP